MDRRGMPTAPAHPAQERTFVLTASPPGPTMESIAGANEAEPFDWPQAEADESLSLAFDDDWPGPFGAAARGMP